MTALISAPEMIGSSFEYFVQVIIEQLQEWFRAFSWQAFMIGFLLIGFDIVKHIVALSIMEKLHRKASPVPAEVSH